MPRDPLPGQARFSLPPDASLELIHPDMGARAGSSRGGAEAWACP